MTRVNDPAGIRARGLASLLLTLLLVSPVRAGFLEELVQTLYLSEVAGYCSLIDESVALGFRHERKRIIDSGGLSRSQVDSANAKAWKLSHAEWQNRGLGGFRAWCRDEGIAAAEYFRKIGERLQ
jgi:hypothetical protein